MSDMSPDRKDKDEALIGQLIQAAGRGPTASAEARERIYTAVHAEWRRNVEQTAPNRGRERAARSRWSVWSKPSLALAATLIVALVVAGVWLRAPAPAPMVDIGAIVKVVGPAGLIGPSGGRAVPLSGPTEVLDSGQVLVTGNNGGVAINLDGGITLRADQNTELLLAGANRLELLAGRIYVDTGADGGVAADLVVDTPRGSVRHTGTQYELRMAGADLRIRVREGSIAFHDDTRDLIGVMGEEILVNAVGAATRGTIAPHDAEWSWTEQLASAPEANEYVLSEILRWVSRQTGRSLRYEGATAENQAAGVTLHGIGGLTPQETLAVLESTTGLQYRLDEDSLVVY